MNKVLIFAAFGDLDSKKVERLLNDPRLDCPASEIIASVARGNHNARDAVGPQIKQWSTAKTVLDAVHNIACKNQNPAKRGMILGWVLEAATPSPNGPVTLAIPSN
jgi:hypothetical protein